MIKSCPVCKSNHNKFKKVFYSDKISKYNNQYFNTLKKSISADCTKVNFVTCKKCTFLFNKSYKQLDYKIEYNANRSYSKKFEIYLDNVVKYLEKFIFKKNNINNILEIGFGDGIFLKKINQLANYNFKKIAGYDPSYNKSKSKIKNIDLIKGYYTEKNFFNPDLIILRHTLEHISDVFSFIKKIVHEKPRFIFIEVPCASFVYNNNFHFFSNEHCSYFDEYNIELLLKKFGYKKIKIKKDFNNENILSIFEKTSQKIQITSKKINYKNKFKFNSFIKKIEKKINFNYDFLWGAAGKGVVLLNILNIDYKKCKYIIDINKEIKGKFLSRSGVKVIGPELIKKYLNKKSKIFIMNSLYKSEITDILKKYKISNKVYCLF
jgi:hypothetical protein